jgi:hypothetical protein
LLALILLELDTMWHSMLHALGDVYDGRVEDEGYLTLEAGFIPDMFVPSSSHEQGNDVRAELPGRWVSARASSPASGHL